MTNALTALLSPNGGITPELIREIEAATIARTEDLHAVQTKIHDNPQLAWEETVAHEECTRYMESLPGWKVTRHAYGFDTAWSAVFDNGAGPVVGFNSEMDALRSVGHACGHNLIAIVGMAAAIATAEVMKAHNVPGKVILLGTPAEEAGGGKSYLVKRGAYDEMDICLMSHPMARGNGSSIPRMACTAGFSVVYKGASAHAAAMPELGVNALDAAVQGYTNVAMLRQQINDKHRIYCTIKGSEKWSANVIASHAEIQVGIRCPTAQETYGLIERALNCFKAGALATGCTYEIRREILYLDVQQSGELEKYHEQVCRDTWGAEGYTYNPDLKMTASTDFGDVTYHLPALHPGFDLPDAAPGDFPHSDTFAKWTGMHSSTVASMRSAASLAAVGMRALVDEKWRSDVRSAWEKQLAAVDGPNMLKALEKLVSQYPAGELAKPVMCCGMGNGNGHAEH